MTTRLIDLWELLATHKVGIKRGHVFFFLYTATISTAGHCSCAGDRKSLFKLLQTFVSPNRMSMMLNVKINK